MDASSLLASHYEEKLQAMTPVIEGQDERLYILKAPTDAGKPAVHRKALNHLVATDQISSYRYIHGDLRQPVVLAVVKRPVSVDG